MANKKKSHKYPLTGIGALTGAGIGVGAATKQATRKAYQVYKNWSPPISNKMVLSKDFDKVMSRHKLMSQKERLQSAARWFNNSRPQGKIIGKRAMKAGLIGAGVGAYIRLAKDSINPKG